MEKVTRCQRRHHESVSCWMWMRRDGFGRVVDVPADLLDGWYSSIWHIELYVDFEFKWGWYASWYSLMLFLQEGVSSVSRCGRVQGAPRKRAASQKGMLSITGSVNNVSAQPPFISMPSTTTCAICETTVYALYTAIAWRWTDQQSNVRLH